MGNHLIIVFIMLTVSLILPILILMKALPNSILNFLKKIIVPFLLIISVYLLVYSFYAVEWWTDGINEIDKKGQIGDKVGGIMNPIIAIAGVIITGLAFWMQYLANKIVQDQFIVQQHDTFFFNLLSLQNNIVKDMILEQTELEENNCSFAEEIKSDITGKNCFRTFFSIYCDQYQKWESDYISDGRKMKKNDFDNLTVEKELSWAAFSDFYLNYESHYKHYIQNLTNILKYIDSSITTNKQFYVDVVIAQMSTYELITLFYYCIYNEKNDDKIEELFYRFSILKNISVIHLRHIEDIKMLPTNNYFTI